MSSWALFTDDFVPLILFNSKCTPGQYSEASEYNPQNCALLGISLQTFSTKQVQPYTANNDRKSKGEESDTASVAISTYRSSSWVVALKRPSGSCVNWLLPSHLEIERSNKPVNLYNASVHKTLSEHATGREIPQSLVIWHVPIYPHEIRTHLY